MGLSSVHRIFGSRSREFFKSSRRPRLGQQIFQHHQQTGRRADRQTGSQGWKEATRTPVSLFEPNDVGP